jgi:maltooligosyltrehalose synthase
MYQMFVNKVLRKVFGFVKDDANEQLDILHDKALSDLYRSPVNSKVHQGNYHGRECL